MATATKTQPQLKDTADIFVRSLYAPRVMGSAAQPISKPGTPLAACEIMAASDPRWRVETNIVERVTIERPDRPGSSRTYDLLQHSPTARRALHRALKRDWSDTGMTAGGWQYYTNR